MRRIATAAVLLATVTLGAQQRAPEIDSITARDMKADLTFLASDRMAGRLTGTPENALAAEWIASRFERLGLKPVGDDGTYYQTFTLATATLGEGNSINVGIFMNDWAPTRFSASGTARGELVFVGYGIVSPERGYDDYGAADVNGKIVVALDHEPGERDENSPFDGVVTSQASDQLQKTLTAQARGAAAILFVSDVHNHAPAQGTTPRPGVNSAAIWPPRPPRIPRVAAWNSEERGLLGAWAYTQAPIYPLAKTAAVLNMDMIGRNEEVPENGGGRFRGLEVRTAESNSNAVNVIGTTRSASLKEAVERANTGVGLTLRLRYDNNISQLMRRSDHWPFLNRGVPAVWIHTGLHPDYHTPNDDADRINYPKMEKIGRMVHQASWDLANAAGRPALDRRPAR